MVNIMGGGGSSSSIMERMSIMQSRRAIGQMSNQSLHARDLQHLQPSFLYSL